MSENISAGDVLPSPGKIIEVRARPPHLVQMGSHVTYVDDVGGRTHRVSVAYPTEANIDEQRVSPHSSWGGAHWDEPAQCIHWRDPDGRTRILAVLDVRAG